MHDAPGPNAPFDGAPEANGFDNTTTGTDLLAPWHTAAGARAVAARLWWLVAHRLVPAVVAAGRDLAAGVRRFEARHHLVHSPAPTRALAATIAALTVVSALGAIGLATANAPAARADLAVGADDPMSHLRVRVLSGRDEAAGEPAEDAAAAPAPALSEEKPAGPVPEPPTLLPTGKGMWFHHLEQAGPLDQAIAHAKATGLTHLYVRLGSSKSGFYAQDDLDALLPAAHAAGLQVVGWDFPYLEDVNGDIARALDQIAYTTPDGHKIDAFSADIETGSEGVRLSTDRVEYYSRNLRYYVGPGYPLIGTVPNACLNKTFPYAEVAASFDAIAPMVYWITRDPGTDVACNIEKLAPLGRPVLPIGQAYDPAIDNPNLLGLIPNYGHLELFMRVAAEHGAAGVSFWVWHTATDEMWKAISDSRDYTLVPMAAGHGNASEVLVLQRLLNTYGYAVPADGRFGPETVGALTQLQYDLGLASTGALDAPTIRVLNARR